MMNSETSSTPSSNSLSHRGSVIALAVISFIGFADAAYLSVKHFMHSVPECSFLKGCDIVTTSSYATIGPVPVALLGALYYLTILVLAIFYLDRKDIRALKLLVIFSLAGLGASIWFVSLQLLVIKAICIYCLGSALTSTLIFVISALLYPKLFKKAK